MSEYENVSRDGSYEDDVLVEKSDNELGLVVPKVISGLRKMDVKTEVIGPGAGALFTLLGTMAARRWGSKLHPVISDNAPLAGMLIGAGLSVPLSMVMRSPKVAQRGIVSSVIVGLALWGLPHLEGLLSGAGPYVPSMGALTMQPVGALPQVADTTRTPAAVSQSLDQGVWGATS